MENIIILLGLVLLNGIFAMSELALVTARKHRLERQAEKGDRSAAMAIRLGEEPTQFLSTIQIGITAIGILNGIVGEAALAGPLSSVLQDLGLSEKTSSLGATTLVVVVITYVTIVLGELVPKRLAQFNAEGVAKVMAMPITWLARIASPFVWILSASTDGILKLTGKKQSDTINITEDDIHAMLIEGSQTGAIAMQEHDMVRNVFRLDDRQIASLMTPRSDIVYLDLDLPLEASIKSLVESEHSRFPVCKGGMNNVLGVITPKRILKHQLEGKNAKELEKLIQPAVFVPESLNGMRLLEQCRDSGVQMVFVVDEYGEIQGLVTLQDILESLTGEFKPRNPEDVWSVLREDGSWLLDGLIPVPELKDRLGLQSVPEEERGNYHTLSGMLMLLMVGVPRTGDVTEWQGWKFEVVDLDGNRIDKVLASRLLE